MYSYLAKNNKIITYNNFIYRLNKIPRKVQLLKEQKGKIIWIKAKITKEELKSREHIEYIQYVLPINKEEIYHELSKLKNSRFTY